MLKFLLIVGLVAYGLYKFGSLFYKAGAGTRQFHDQQQPRSNGNIHVDSNPKKKSSKFKGGEYVDYEEVK